MSFENIDINFEKVAQQRLKSKEKQTEQVAQDESQDKEKYENKIKESALSGLLQVFQNKLNNKNPNFDNDTDSNEEFETIDFSSKSLYVREPDIEKVSEKQLNNLIGDRKFEVPNTKVRYDQINKPINNVPSANDIKSQQTLQPSDQGLESPTNNNDVNRMSDDQIKEKIAEHKKKKTKDAT